MKKAFATIGLFVVASQIAFGSAATLFLCLCMDAVPCEPPSPVALDPDSCCQHEQVPAQEDENCEDILLGGLEFESTDRTSDTVKIKAPLAANCLLQASSRPMLPALAVSTRIRSYTSTSNATSVLCTRTVKFLL